MVNIKNTTWKGRLSDALRTKDKRIQNTKQKAAEPADLHLVAKCLMPALPGLANPGERLKADTYVVPARVIATNVCETTTPVE